MIAPPALPSNLMAGLSAMRERLSAILTATNEIVLRQVCILGKRGCKTINEHNARKSSAALV